MKDTLWQLFLSGSDIIWWLLGLLATFAMAYLRGLIKNTKINDIVGRALGEVRDAVREVYQTVVADLKAKSADGKLTDKEKADAKALAIKLVRENIGMKGLAALMRVLGLDDVDSWLGTKVEAVIDALKNEGKSKVTLTGAEVKTPPKEPNPLP